VDFGHYGDASLELALDLANTRPTDQFPEELPDEASLGALLEGHDIALPDGGVTAVDLAEVHDLREQLVAVLQATDLAAAAEVLNDVMERGAALPSLTDHDGDGWHLHYESRDGRLVSRLAAICGPTLALLLRDVGLARIGECQDDTCESFYVDASRNAVRRYCCHRCATRSSVAAYRRRQRTADVTD